MNADMIIQRLKDRYPLGDGWITMAEVTPPGCRRRFDLIAIMGWQSRGHEVMGFEVKVARSDWLAELKDPAKAEPLASLCSRWWIAAPPGVVAKDEMPAGWGLLTVHPEIIRADKQAALREVAPWSDGIWRCMLLRCATRERHQQSDIDKARSEAHREAWANADEHHKQTADGLRKALQDQQSIIDKAEAATGVHISQWTDWPEIGEAMQVIRSARAGHHHRQIERMRRDAESLRAAADAMDKAAETLTPKTTHVSSDEDIFG